MNLSTLYLCYFGLREPLVQTQVIPYLKQIALDNVKVSLLTFEPNFSENWSKEEIEAEKQKLSSQKIDWHCLPYHKSPSVPATLYDVFAGARFARRMIRRENITVLHARAHIAAMMGAFAGAGGGKKTKLLFDIRGFLPEEYTDGGSWRENGKLYRVVKRAEKWLIEKADGFVVLTERAREILFPESAEDGFDRRGRPVEVIPCCVDLQKFEAANEQTRNEMRAKLNLGNRRVIVYVGSFGTWYLADEMADLMATARERDDSTFALILTQSPPELMTQKLVERGFGEADFLVKKVSPAELPTYLCATDAALSFIKACYSKQASSPTKIAEYLAAGVPIITNRGVGDVAEVIEADLVGAVVENFNHESYLVALDTIETLQKDASLAVRCRRSAKDRFDLAAVGGAKYRFLYQRLANSETDRR